MRKRRALLLSLAWVLCLATVARAQQASRTEPFGFREGMTRSEIFASLGRGAAVIDDGDVLVLRTAPKPDPDFPLYVVCLSDQTGIAKVGGMLGGIVTSPDGESVRSAFLVLRSALEADYGKPTIMLDFLMRGSTWNRPEDWMTGLMENERMLAAVWDPDQQGVSIAEEARALTPEFGYVMVTYEFASFESWEREHRRLRNES